MRLKRVAVVVASACASGVILASSNVQSGYELAWAENIGWWDWRQAAGGEQGVRAASTFLAGHIWSENAGWISLGNGAPASGLHYSNLDGSDYGVNIDPANGDLYGFGWGENIGWISFDTRSSLAGGGRQARIDFVSGRLHGYAWGENVGWLNLDDAVEYVAFAWPTCHEPFADADGDGDVDQADFAVLQRCLTNGSVAIAEGCECFNRPQPGFIRGDDDVDADDLSVFLSCSSGPALPADPLCGGG
jgi:hypothetical protein